MTDLCGQTLSNRYLMEQCIGVGGFARVYRAVDTRLGCHVAIKVLHPEHTRNIADLERFRNEARIAGRIDDEHFVKVTDFLEDEHFGFVMEHLQGVTLRDELKGLPGKSMPWPRAFKIARQVCAGLGVAHARGLIHRDIKPENIFLKRPGNADQVKLLDLGVVKILEDHNWSGLQKNLSNTGDIIGSPCYIAPEQVKGQRFPDARVDIYALGIVLYEMVAGQVPFRGKTAYETMEHHVRSEPERPTILVPHLRLPRQIEDIILRALKKRPGERYRSAQEMDAALRNELDMNTAERRVRAVQFIQISPEPPRRGEDPGTIAAPLAETEREDTTTRRHPREPGSADSRVDIVPAASAASGSDARSMESDLTPAHRTARQPTPEAQRVTTVPDLDIAPMAANDAARHAPAPLRTRTRIYLASLAVASLLVTWSASFMLARALDTRHVDAISSRVVTWPADPASASVEEVPAQHVPEPLPADPVDDIAVDDDVEEEKPTKNVAESEAVRPAAPRRPPPKRTLAIIANRAAAQIKQECRLAMYYGKEKATYPVRFELDPATGTIEKVVPGQPRPLLADNECVLRKILTGVKDFGGATDLRSSFVHNYVVVR